MNNGSCAQQLGIACFKNFWTLFRIIEGMDKQGSHKQGSTVHGKNSFLADLHYVEV